MLPNLSISTNQSKLIPDLNQGFFIYWVIIITNYIFIIVTWIVWNLHCINYNNIF